MEEKYIDPIRMKSSIPEKEFRKAYEQEPRLLTEVETKLYTFIKENPGIPAEGILNEFGSGEAINKAFVSLQEKGEIENRGPIFSRIFIKQ